MLSRAIVELFSDPHIAGALAFRGGTALHKLFFETPGRYSEDIDLVQCDAGPIGPTLDAIRARLDPWLGTARAKQAEGGATLVYRFETTTAPVQSMRVKIEINTREHFAELGLRRVPFRVMSPWFDGSAEIQTFVLEELLSTKLRALYQRKKGRDLYDLYHALTTAAIDDARVVACFERYMRHGGHAVRRDEFEANLANKLEDAAFLGDLSPLLVEHGSYEAQSAAGVVSTRLISKLPEHFRRSKDR